MRGRKITKEEMECPEKLLNNEMPCIQGYENYVFLLPPASIQKRFAQEEIAYRVEKWRMTRVEIETEDYLSAIIGFCREIYAHAKSQKYLSCNLLIECPFEDEYMDWLANGMTKEELDEYLRNLNKLIYPLLYPLEFVQLEDERVFVETGNFAYCEEWGICGIIGSEPKIYNSPQERKRLNGGITKDGKCKANN